MGKWKYSLLCMFVVPAAFASPPRLAEFRAWGGELASYVPPQEHGRAMSSWTDETTLLVQAVVLSTAGQQVDPSGGTATVDGDDVRLCYRMKPAIYGANAPVPSAAYPQVVEFTLQNLPFRHGYRVMVQRDCRTDQPMD